MTLAELMIAVSVGSIVLAAGTAFFVDSLRKSVAVANYYGMDNSSRSALGRMTKEIRQADKLTFCSSTQMEFQTTDPNTLAVSNFTYTYNLPTKTLSRKPCARASSCQSKVVLNDCQLWQVGFFQRTPIGGTYDQYPILDPAHPDLCKVVQLTWNCSRGVLGRPDVSEGVQSAKIVMRKP
jgi:Tfp pilus assembly protein PilW